MSAPVGTYYTDINATLGALRWVKQTGTGNTGWAVLFGDTGARNLAPLLINGWTATHLYIRRINEMVQLYALNLNPANAVADEFMNDIGDGWRVSTYFGASNVNAYLPIGANGNPLIMARVFLPPAPNGGPFRLQNRSAPAGQQYVGVLNWLVGAETWPSSTVGT